MGTWREPCRGGSDGNQKNMVRGALREPCRGGSDGIERKNGGKPPTPPKPPKTSKTLCFFKGNGRGYLQETVGNLMGIRRKQKGAAQGSCCGLDGIQREWQGLPLGNRGGFDGNQRKMVEVAPKETLPKITQTTKTTKNHQKLAKPPKTTKNHQNLMEIKGNGKGYPREAVGDMMELKGKVVGGPPRET